MLQAKQVAVAEFCRAARLSAEQVRGKILSVAGDGLNCYDDDFSQAAEDMFVDIMLLDGCFLLQFMISMARRPDDDADPDPFMSRADVHTRIDTIARDVLLLENQIPWFVLQALMELRPSAVPVVELEVVADSFLALMASAFDIGNVNATNPPTSPSHSPTTLQAQQQSGDDLNDDGIDQPPAPLHLLALFYHRQMGAAPAPTRSIRVPTTLSSVSSTAVELTEMGVKLVAGKTNKFGDMVMTKRPRFGLFGELSLAPLVLTEVTKCWLFNMAAYEASLGFTRADVSSYVTLISLLMNRREDVQEMRAKGIVISAFSDEETLGFFKLLAPRLQVGHRYYDVFQRLQEYRKERWLWIAVHKFLYNNIKTIIAVLSVVGVLAGLFKTILSLKQPSGNPA